MILASLSDTYTGAILGAVITAYGTKNNPGTTPKTLRTGAFYGALCPSVINLIHTTATKVFELIHANFSYLKEAIPAIPRSLVACAQANPYTAAAVAIGLTALASYYYLYR